MYGRGSWECVQADFMPQFLGVSPILTGKLGPKINREPQENTFYYNRLFYIWHLAPLFALKLAR
ncbi:hypothetical protein BJL95_22355 [Methylomonas sp. LWB]|nr:hypothetical protein BJL95_22355 [Methylomonas sp. LWB]